MWQSLERRAERLLEPFGVTPEQLLKLFTPIDHSGPIRRHVAGVILARVRFVSALFAVLVPAMAVVDLLVFDLPEAMRLTALRLAAAAVFTALAWPRELSAKRPTLQAAVLLLIMLQVPPAFYLLSLPILSGVELTPLQAMVAQLYAFMPTIVLAGLAVFPLTAVEVVAFSVPAVVVGLASIFGDGGLDLQRDGPAIWFMAMMMGLAMFSGMSQLHYMATLVARAMTDSLTGAYTRRSGTEALDLMFRMSMLSGKPLTVLFFDLDHFKTINDVHGHEAGDQALKALVLQLRGTLRRGDVVVRWGGEEFLALLPDMPAEAVPGLLRRLRADAGLGMRPDGRPLTASIGVAETVQDAALDWSALVELADQRMYEAKRDGRDRAVLPGQEVLILGAGDTGAAPSTPAAQPVAPGVA